MGDADHEVSVPVQEIEEWVDDALDVVDEGLRSLLVTLAYLDNCVNQVSLQLKKIETFRRSFLALQLLVVPIIIIIFLYCGMSEANYQKQTSKSSVLVDGLVTLLTLFSGCIGMPYYLFLTCQYYLRDEEINEDISCYDKDDPQVFEAMPTVGENFNFLSNGPSMERFNNIIRLLSSGILERARTEADLISFDQSGGGIQVQKAEINASVDVDQSDDTPEISYEQKDTSENNDQANTVSFPVLYEFQIRMREQSPDLAIKIAPQDAEEDGDGISETGIQLTTKQQENLSTGTQMGTSLI